MPARRLHKTKTEQERAARNKHRGYYNRNRETILSKKRKKYSDHTTQESLARKDKNEEKKRALWEARAAEEIQPQKSIERLRDLERAINAEINSSATQPYFERLYYEFLTWSSCDPRPSNSPIELPFKLFGSMLNSVANIGNAILNEYGAIGKEWKEAQRLTRRIRYLNVFSFSLWMYWLLRISIGLVLHTSVIT
ncbi:hypothetical protein PQX77_005452 [Marasmius sp. AFHP31]|nr:hypothetical protein PQX77_005452 [Marasmius sp. AFHP31]